MLRIMATRISLACLLALVVLPATGGATAAPPAPAAAPRYTAHVDTTARIAAVTLCPGFATARLRVAADSSWAMRFIDDIARSGAGDVVRDDDGWHAVGWRADECLRYHADLGAIAKTGKPDIGWQLGDDLVAAPTLWLLRVAGTDAPVADARIAIDLPEGWSLSAPWRGVDCAAPSAPGQRCFTIPGTPPDWSAAVAIGRFTEQRIGLPQGTLRLAILAGADAAQRAALRAWFDRVSQAILSAYGRLPLPDVQVLMIPLPGRARDEGVIFGQSVRGQGNALQLLVDPTRPAQDFAHDWMAVHELSHLMHPYLGDRGAWLAEGLATYYQNVLRARAGIFSADDAWAELADGFRRGAASHDTETLAAAAEHMHRSHAFTRVYWTGAAFWLDVDETLRREHGDAHGLDDVLGRFAACCLPAYQAWTPEAFVARLDSLAGSQRIEALYRDYAARTAFPDRVRLLGAVGVDLEGKPRADADAAARALGAGIMRRPVER